MNFAVDADVKMLMHRFPNGFKNVSHKESRNVTQKLK